MLEIKNVSKSYGDKIGNFDISLSIKDGETYGIIGPNGAGKTTLIRQMMGFVKPDSGSISILNLDPWSNHAELMQYIGYLPGEVEVLDGMKGSAYLKMIADLKGNADWSYVEKLIEHFQLDARRKFKQMSKGMKQKVAIIAAVMSKPKFLILDEPTSGLDPLMQDQFNQLVKKMNEEGTTIIICSHIFSEIAKLCDRVGFIKEGKLISEKIVKGKKLEEIEEEFIRLYSKECAL